MSNFKQELIKVCIIMHLVLAPLLSSGQNDSTGIFARAEDFLSNRLTYSASCSNEENKIKFGGKFIKVKIEEGSQKGTYKLKNDKIFGLKTCKNTYRFQDGLDYKVINTKYIPMYTRSIMTGGDGAFYEDQYYFSVRPEGKIQPLTKGALKEAYSSNPEFVSYIESSFKNDRELGVYNDQLKQYMLIYFFERSEK
jgi:hypothetical protein